MLEKNVGILTFSYSSNPGSVLQAYVLQETISEMDGCTASIINYQKTQAGKPVLGKTVFYQPIRKWTIGKIAEWCARLFVYPIRMRKYEKFFKNFYNGYPTKRVFKSELPELNTVYDKFVVGSDQVWNFDSYNVDTTYFLDFVTDSVKKVSYAASFGKGNIPEAEKVRAKELISDFYSISVRESEGVNTVFNLTGRQAEWVLDPSLLWDKERYSKMSILPSKKNYVFLYLREDSARLEAFANKLASHHNLTVVKVLKHWRCNKQGKPVSALGPLEWLGFMEEAQFVVTNSFHGICFSLIFEKEFFVDLLKEGKKTTNLRIEDLLKQFALTSRTIDKMEIASIEEIDYEQVNRIKKERRQHSLKYLEKAIERT